MAENAARGIAEAAKLEDWRPGVRVLAFGGATTLIPALRCASLAELRAAWAGAPSVTLVHGADALDPAQLTDTPSRVVFLFDRAPSARWSTLAEATGALLAAPEGPCHRFYPAIATELPRTKAITRVWLDIADPSLLAVARATIPSTAIVDAPADADLLLDLGKGPLLSLAHLPALGRGALLVSDRPFDATLGLEANEDYLRLTDPRDAIGAVVEALTFSHRYFGVRVRAAQKLRELFSAERVYDVLVHDASRRFAATERTRGAAKQ